MALNSSVSTDPAVLEEHVSRETGKPEKLVAGTELTPWPTVELVGPASARKLLLPAGKRGLLAVPAGFTPETKADVAFAGTVNDVMGALACAGAPPKTAPLSPVVQTSVALDGADLSLHLPTGREPPLPGVLVFHSAMGPTDAVLGYADMLAQAGFGVGALDLYGGRVPADVTEARSMRDELNARALDFPALLSAAQDVLEKDERVRADHHYVVGWSYGGALATLAAGWLDRISGVIAIYGEAFGDDPARFDAVSAPVLLIGGRTDTEPSPARLQEVGDALSRAGKDASVVVLDAGHGFMEPRHPGFDQEAASAAWLEVRAFLEARER